MVEEHVCRLNIKYLLWCLCGRRLCHGGLWVRAPSEMLRAYLYEYFPDIVFFDQGSLFLVFLYLLVEVSIVGVLHDDTLDISIILLCFTRGSVSFQWWRLLCSRRCRNCGCWPECALRSWRSPSLCLSAAKVSPFWARILGRPTAVSPCTLKSKPLPLKFLVNT